MDLAGRVAVVTGAGTGIGRAIALGLSHAGAAVGLIGRTRATLEAVAGDAAGETCVVTADVCDRGSVEGAFETIAKRLGPLHVVVANAGMEQGYHTSWIPSYGPEMRGGTAYCFVNVSETPVGSPTVTNPDVLVAFNRPSMEKFEPDVRENGLMLYDSSIIDVEPRRDD
ncbi:MAG: SDR family NAD(P)-dependent oxidoreductase, partial [Myxococcota bacterium]